MLNKIQLISKSLDLGGCGKALLTPRHSLNAFFRSPSQLDVRTGGSQQKLTAHFALSNIRRSGLNN